MLDARFWQGKRVFVTGHTGFKGSWLCLLLRKLGANVGAFALDPETNPSLFHVLNGPELVDKDIRGDIRNRESLKAAVTDYAPDIVLHLAAQSLVRRSYTNPHDTYSTNVMGTLNVLEAVREAKSVRSTIIVTTDKCYENNESGVPFKEEDPLGGYDPYSSSKACAEILTSSYRRSYFNEGECRVFTVRAGNVIGGGDWSVDRIIADVVTSIISGKELQLRNPEAVRPWQHVLEPLEAYLLIAEKGYLGTLASGSYNVGPDPDAMRTVAWIVKEFGKTWGGEITKSDVSSRQPHEATHLTLDISKISHDLSWKPRLDIKEAVRLTAEWYKNFYENPERIQAISSSHVDQFLAGIDK